MTTGLPTRLSVQTGKARYGRTSVGCGNRLPFVANSRPTGDLVGYHLGLSIYLHGMTRTSEKSETAIAADSSQLSKRINIRRNRHEQEIQHRRN
jgi:hypothetical protein